MRKFVIGVVTPGLGVAGPCFDAESISCNSTEAVQDAVSCHLAGHRNIIKILDVREAGRAYCELLVGSAQVCHVADRRLMLWNETGAATISEVRQAVEEIVPQAIVMDWQPGVIPAGVDLAALPNVEFHELPADLSLQGAVEHGRPTVLVIFRREYELSPACLELIRHAVANGVRHIETRWCQSLCSDDRFQLFSNQN